MSKSAAAFNTRDRILLKELDVLLTKEKKCSRSVKYYAEHLAISPRKINSLTKACCGKTAKEYIEEKIIRDSKLLLLETPETIKQISYILGFTEPTNFNKFFKKNTAITPRQFRELHNKGSF